MDNKSSNREKLRTLNEEDFRANVLMPLLRRLGYEKVRERHGSAEYGKDITFYEPSRLGDGLHYAVVAKVGNLSGSASGQQNYYTLRNQINEAFDMPIPDIETRMQSRVNCVIVWTSGNISAKVQQQILNEADPRFRNVTFRTGDATIELLDKYYPEFFTIGDERLSNYYSTAKKTYTQLEQMRALGAGAGKQLPVIFVPPTFTPVESSKKKATKRPVPRGGKPRKGRFHFDKPKTISFEKLLKLRKNLLIVGGAGAGKSTLLQAIFLKIIENNEQKAEARPIPVLLEFKKLNLDDEECLAYAIREQLTRFSAQDDPVTVEEDLANGNIILILDGLDELRLEERIEVGMQRVREFRQQYPHTRIVATSRLLGLVERPGAFAGFSIFQIANLSSSQMQVFIEKWFGTNSPAGRKLARLINDPLGLRGLPATPLTLALIAIVYEGGARELPANLTELFQKYVDLALGRWDDSKNLASQIEWRIKEFMLRKLAWTLQQTRMIDIDEDEFYGMITALASERGWRQSDLAGLPQEIIQRSELLFRNSDGNFEFKHRSFQEYFVGAELNGMTTSAEVTAVQFLDPWWTGPIFFACGLRPDSPEYLTAVLEQVNIDHPHSLAYAVNLALLVQAAYLAPVEVKRQCAYRVLDSFTEGWDQLAHDYERVIKNANEVPDEIKQLPAHIVLVTLYTGIIQASLGSVTLSTVLSEIANTLIAERSIEVSEREHAKREWWAFLVAVACARADCVDSFAALYETGTITDPVFMVMGRGVADAISRSDWLDDKDKSAALRLIEYLERRIARRKDYLESLQNRDPIPLPPGD